MDVIWEAVLTVLTLIGWVGQVIYASSPQLGARLVWEKQNLTLNQYFTLTHGVKQSGMQ